MAFRLHNSVQGYAWGSPDGISTIFGIPNPAGGPVAEVWMGAHPKAPSQVETVDGTVRLDEYISRDPEGTLGAQVRRAHGDRLPYLFKMLAAAEPLSIQAHPSKSQAAAGFERENSAGIPRDAARRNYRDDNHKPELIYAMTVFWGLRGFRPPREIRDYLEPVASGSELRLPSDDAGLPVFFRSLMTLPLTSLSAILAAAVVRAESAWPDLTLEPQPGDPATPHYWVQLLSDKYPGDPGILAPLFLNVFCLQPGEATFQPAGVLHAYLRGVGVELMANSDNVLRGGLTVKHVDLDELLSVGVFRTEEPQTLTGERGDGPESGQHDPGLTFPTPFRDFQFTRIDVPEPAGFTSGRPRIILCSEGRVSVRGNGSRVDLERGQSAFVRADERDLRVEGTGTALIASSGEEPS